MFDFEYVEDYIVAGVAVIGLFKVGKFVVNAALEAKDKIDTMNRESSNEWDALTNKRYQHVADKLTATKASPKARCEAYKHCHMLIEKEIEFYATNKIAREKAHAFNNVCLQNMLQVWAAA